MHNTKHHLKKKSGFSFLEVMILIVIVSVAIAGLVTSQTRLVLSDEAQKEDIIALQACEDKLEQLREAATTDFSTFFSTYNLASANDNFDVPGLNVQEDDLDGMCGRIVFPETGGLLNQDLTTDLDWDPATLDMDADPSTTGTISAGSMDNVVVMQIKVIVEYKSVLGKDRERKIVATIYGS